MTHASTTRKADTVTFRIDPDLKVELTRVAERDSRSLGELLRELIRTRVEAERRREFEAEAQRQSQAIAERALDPATDEYAMMQELEADLEQSTGE
jgi:predicted transcriptional regulator